MHCKIVKLLSRSSIRREISFQPRLANKIGSCSQMMKNWKKEKKLRLWCFRVCCQEPTLAALKPDKNTGQYFILLAAYSDATGFFCIFFSSVTITYAQEAYWHSSIAPTYANAPARSFISKDVPGLPNRVGNRYPIYPYLLPPVSVISHGGAHSPWCVRFIIQVLTKCDDGPLLRVFEWNTFYWSCIGVVAKPSFAIHRLEVIEA